MSKRSYRTIALMMCSVIIMTGDVSHVSQTKPTAVYSIAKTMSSSVAVNKLEETDTDDTEPYFLQQWALYNDGTFSIQDNAADGSRFHNGGFYNPGDITNGNDLIGQPKTRNNFNAPGSVQIRFPNGNIRKNSEVSVQTTKTNSLNNTTSTAVAGIDIDITKAWDKLKDKGREVIVAVIDTGVDYTHEDLADVIWTNKNEIANDGIDNDKNGYIDDVYGWDFYNNTAYVYNKRNASEYDHGTHCAGSIAAEINDTGIAGIASNTNVKIMSLKVLGGSDGSGETEAVINAIKYAEKMGAVICNFSFGSSTYDEQLAAAIKNSKMLFVCAAGNGNSKGIGIDTDNSPIYPADFDFDNIISVANLKCNGTLDTSSNYGKKSVDIAAPGTYILSTTAGNEYEYLSGTSMSAPIVTGVLAMTYSYYDDITALDAKKIVLSTAEPLDSLTDKVATNGMVNAYNAITADVDKILK